MLPASCAAVQGLLPLIPHQAYQCNAVAWSEEAGNTAIQHGDLGALWRAVLALAAMSAWCTPASSRAQQECSITSLLLSLYTPLPTVMVHRHTGKKHLAEQSAVATLHTSPNLASPCPSVAHPSSFRAQRGPEIPPQRYVPFRLISISPDMLHKALKPQRKWRVVFVPSTG